MKRLCPSNKLITNNSPLLVRLQFALFSGYLFSEFFKTLFHRLCGGGGIGVVNGHLIESTVQEFPLHGGCGGIRKHAFLRLNSNNPQSGLLAGDENIKIKGMFGRPCYQFFRSISPLQAEGRLDNGLGTQVGACKSREQSDQEKDGIRAWFRGKNRHGSSLPRAGRFRKSRTLRRGIALVEATMAISMLSVTGLLLLKLSLNVIAPRQYALQQVLSDSYMTFERSRAERIPFESLLSEDSPWPFYPDISSMTVEIGKLPGGAPITGTISRTRMPDTNNFPIDGDATSLGTLTSNPAAMKIWRVQSVLRYEISGRTYVKSRTLVRAQ